MTASAFMHSLLEFRGPKSLHGFQPIYLATSPKDLVGPFSSTISSNHLSSFPICSPSALASAPSPRLPRLLLLTAGQDQRLRPYDSCDLYLEWTDSEAARVESDRFRQRAFSTLVEQLEAKLFVSARDVLTDSGAPIGCRGW
jgi:hypothetical protein